MENQNELRHYGVKGMKWGVRRAMKKGGEGVDKHYQKASRKLQKLDSKMGKLEAKAEKASAKADKKMTSFVARDKTKLKAEAKARKAAAKLSKRVNKGKKWYQAMEKTFADTPVSLTSDQKKIGKKFEDMSRARMIGRY